MNILGFYKNFKHSKDEIAINLRKSEDKRVELLVKIFFWRNDSIKINGILNYLRFVTLQIDMILLIFIQKKDLYSKNFGVIGKIVFMIG